MVTQSPEYIFANYRYVERYTDGVVRIRRRKHLVEARKTSCFWLKHLVMWPQTTRLLRNSHFANVDVLWSFLTNYSVVSQLQMLKPYCSVQQLKPSGLAPVSLRPLLLNWGAEKGGIRGKILGAHH